MAILWEHESIEPGFGGNLAGELGDNPGLRPLDCAIGSSIPVSRWCEVQTGYHFAGRIYVKYTVGCCHNMPVAN